jgi:hypothetical protein
MREDKRARSARRSTPPCPPQCLALPLAWLTARFFALGAIGLGAGQGDAACVFPWSSQGIFWEDWHLKISSKCLS